MKLVNRLHLAKCNQKLIRTSIPLLIVLFMVIPLPLTIAYQNDDLEPIFGLNWNDPQELLGNWKLIGNRTLYSSYQHKRQDSWLRITTDIPDNITWLSIGFELDMPEYVGHKDNVTMSNSFMTHFGGGQCNLVVEYTRRQKGNWFWSGQEYFFVMKVSHPSKPALDTIFSRKFDKSEGFMDRFYIGYKLMNNGDYLLEVYAEFYKYELQSSDLYDPTDYKYMSKRSLFFGIWTYREYRLYSTIETVTTSLSDPTEMTWRLTKDSADMTASCIRSRIHDDMTFLMNATYVTGDSALRDVVGEINLMGKLVEGTGKAFNALRLKAIGNFIITLSEPIGEVTDSILGMMPIMLGMYAVFLFAIVFKGIIGLDFGGIMSHFLGMFAFIMSIINTVLRLFWGIISAISSVPFGNIILAFGLIAILGIIGISIS